MIKIICVGKLKEKYLIDMVNDYKTRINKYHKLEIIEIKDNDIETESKKILSLIKSDYVITLDIQGEMLTSEKLSTTLNSLFTNGKSQITFIIGGSEGLSEKVKKVSDYSLSFSKMTFPHGLFRAIVLEQIYRSFKIIQNEKYHK